MDCLVATIRAVSGRREHVFVLIGALALTWTFNLKVSSGFGIKNLDETKGDREAWPSVILDRPLSPGIPKSDKLRLLGKLFPTENFFIEIWVDRCQNDL
jgi:hypothetical protein